jgi:4-diphosphocytidyl-2-C-methyl-D-erythritol kinase
MRALAFAKINLSLNVGAGGGPRHPVRGLFQSIGWGDRLTLEMAEEDVIAGEDGRPVIAGEDNLAWQAAVAVRELAEAKAPMALTLDKEIPVAAGLGGGSADAAAALALAGRLCGVGGEAQATLAATLGSDVPFCLSGGLAHVSGTGEVVEPLEPAGGYALALVVPPVEVSTAAVYAAWDLLDGPEGPATGGNDLPPALRGMGPLRNDLYPAAAAVAPVIDEWRAEMVTRWGRPVILTGSGPTLFAFFVDEAEATAALEAAPVGARALRATEPVGRGWEFVDSG